MKLLRHGQPGQERPGLIDIDGQVRDLSGVLPDIEPDYIPRLDEVQRLDPRLLPLVPAGQRLGPCVGRIGKFICVGLNYVDHAHETNSPIPAEPILFMKATSAVCGPNDDVVIPPGSEKKDWEVELGVVIGRTARRVQREAALDHVAGYCVVNDVSERAWQLEHGGQWVKGKSADTFGPLGPWLVTRDEVPNPQNLRLWLKVDGRPQQDDTTATMIFPVAELVAYASQFMTLMPGDVISTGTPPGVGLGRTPPVFLRAGQTMRLGIEGLGEQRQRTVASEASAA